MTQSKTRPAAYSMGSGHTLGDATTVISPGPVYDTRERPVGNSILVGSLRMIRHLICTWRRQGSGSAIVAGLPTYKFGSAKAREDYQAGAKTPGPDRYRPNLKSSKKAAPRFTMCVPFLYICALLLREFIFILSCPGMRLIIGGANKLALNHHAAKLPLHN
eukprot:SAG31_NODE_788_length_12088_cov_3.916090_9_plen_161_part_00